MSIDIVIKQTAFLKKTLPLDIILGNELRYGYYEDNFRLNDNELKEGEFLAYHPSHISRGINVVWNEQERNQVLLRLLSPTSKAELKDFYDVIKRIMNYWKANLEVDGNLISIEDFEAGFDEAIKFNQEALLRMAKDVISDKYRKMTLISTMWPLDIGHKEAQSFLDNPDSFDIWLHDHQSIDAYYPKPRFYKNELGIIGVYVLTQDLLSIFPIKPYVPFSYKNIECDKYYISLFSSTLDKQVGMLPYQIFIDNLDKDKVSYFDANDILIEGLSLEEMQSLFNKCKK